MAGGDSSRMGQRKELMRLPDGRPMVAKVVAMLREVCRDVVVVGTTDALPELTHIEDLRPRQGPLGGIEALLASDRDSQYLLCPCDMPHVSIATLRRLVEDDSSTISAFQVAGEEQPRSMPLRIHARALGDVVRLLDEEKRAVYRLTQCSDVGVVRITAEDGEELLNVNTPEEWATISEA